MDQHQIIEVNREKQRIRQMIKARLAEMTDEEYVALNQSLYKRFLARGEVQKAASVMIYYSIGREVKTISLISKLLTEKKVVGLPVCLKNLSLSAVRVESLDQLVERKFKKLTLIEPNPSLSKIAPNDLELIVLPGMAFDKKGNRLGHGAGYYDRFLENIPESTFKMGLAYDFQVISALPAAPHDLPVDGILTPTNYYQISPISPAY